MRRVAILTLLLVLTGCDNAPWPRTPSSRIADEIEAKLTHVPCVGPMSRWERQYSYTADWSDPTAHLTFRHWAWWFDYNAVDFTYRQAGYDEFRPRRVFYRGAKPIDIDDRQDAQVWGHYDIPKHTAYIWACGQRATSPDHPYMAIR